MTHIDNHTLRHINNAQFFWDTAYYLNALADYILDPFSQLDGSDIDG